MKQGIYIGIILLSLSAYAFAADKEATSETNAKPIAPTNAPKEAGKPITNPQNTNEASSQKTSIADYCREHTC